MVLKNKKIVGGMDADDTVPPNEKRKVKSHAEKVVGALVEMRRTINQLQKENNSLSNSVLNKAAKAGLDLLFDALRSAGDGIRRGYEDSSRSIHGIDY